MSTPEAARKSKKQFIAESPGNLPLPIHEGSETLHLQEDSTGCRGAAGSHTPPAAATSEPTGRGGIQAPSDPPVEMVDAETPVDRTCKRNPSRTFPHGRNTEQDGSGERGKPKTDGHDAEGQAGREPRTSQEDQRTEAKHPSGEQGTTLVTLRTTANERLEDFNLGLPSCLESPGPETGEHVRTLDHLSGLWEPLGTDSRGPGLFGQSGDTPKDEPGGTRDLRGMQTQNDPEEVSSEIGTVLGVRAIPEVQSLYQNPAGCRRNGSAGRQSLYEAASQRQDRVKNAFLLTCTLCALMPFAKKGEQEQ